MSYIPSEEALNQYDQPNSSLGKSYSDYLKGLGAQLSQSAAMGGYNIAKTLLPKSFDVPKPDVLGFAPESEASQTGKNVGETVADIASLMIPGRLGLKGLSAVNKFMPFTKSQMSRQFQEPIDAAEKAGIKRGLDANRLYELSDLLSHPALEPRGAAGRGLTSMGRHAAVQGAAEGDIPSLHSAQSLLGDLERVVPAMGEISLARTRITPLKKYILEQITQGMKDAGLNKEAENYNLARAAAQRHFKTKSAIKKGAKAITLGALIKTGLEAAKKLP